MREALASLHDGRPRLLFLGQPDELSEMRVVVPDRPGSLAEVTTTATEADINIFDLEIAHSSEGDRGVLILLVESDQAGRLHDALVRRGYRVSHKRMLE